MIKMKVLSVGNALGVVLPKAALECLHLQKGDTLTLSAGADGMYVLSPSNEGLAREVEAAEEEISHYRVAMRDLAKR